MIGQDYAKKVLSVAVYNHYKRINVKKQSTSKWQQQGLKMSQHNHPSSSSSSHIWNSGIAGLNSLMAIHPHFGSSAGGRPAAPIAQTESVTETSQKDSQPADKKQTLKVKVDKSNVLLLGPTGSGKWSSHVCLCRLLLKCMSVL